MIRLFIFKNNSDSEMKIEIYSSKINDAFEKMKKTFGKDWNRLWSLEKIINH